LNGHVSLAVVDGDGQILLGHRPRPLRRKEPGGDGSGVQIRLGVRRVVDQGAVHR
jgi:hypothetical protein